MPSPIHHHHHHHHHGHGSTIIALPPPMQKRKSPVLFPPELWLDVFSYLSYYDLLRISRVSTYFHALTQHASLDLALFRAGPPLPPSASRARPSLSFSHTSSSSSSSSSYSSSHPRRISSLSASRSPTSSRPRGYTRTHQPHPVFTHVIVDAPSPSSTASHSPGEPAIEGKHTWHHLCHLSSLAEAFATAPAAARVLLHVTCPFHWDPRTRGTVHIENPSGVTVAQVVSAFAGAMHHDLKARPYAHAEQGCYHALAFEVGRVPEMRIAGSGGGSGGGNGGSVRGGGGGGGGDGMIGLGDQGGMKQWPVVDMENEMLHDEMEEVAVEMRAYVRCIPALMGGGGARSRSHCWKNVSMLPGVATG